MTEPHEVIALVDDVFGWQIERIQLSNIEIVRCRDCLFFDEFQRRHICTKHKHTVTEDGFCAWGEKKDGIHNSER